MGKVSSLAADKLPELRQVAAEALAAVYHRLSRDALLSSILSAAPALQLILRQALSSALPSLDAELQQASMAFHTGFQAGSPARKAPPSPAAASCIFQASSQASQTNSLSGEAMPPLQPHQDCWSTLCSGACILAVAIALWSVVHYLAHAADGFMLAPNCD